MVKGLLSANKIEEANSVLELILASEEGSKANSCMLLSFLSPDYMSPTTPSGLQKRFLRLCIAAAQTILLRPAGVDPIYAEQGQFINAILKTNLSKIEALLPAEYPQALAMTNSLRKAMPESFKERDEIYNRINQSKDKLEQTISEAESADDKDLKNGLWEDAAQLAVEKRMFRLAVDCFEKVDLKDEEFFLRRDEFLAADVVGAALKGKDPESAEYALKHIKSQLHAAAAMLQIAVYLHKNKDVFNARLKLTGAINKIQSSDNEPEKIRELRRAMEVAAVVDKDSLFDIAQLIIKTANSLPPLKDGEDPGGERRKQYAEDVEMAAAWSIFPAFQTLAGDEPFIAGNITSNFSEHKYRVISAVAAEIGAFEAKKYK